MTLGELPWAAAAEALRAAGLTITFGPFAVRLKIHEPGLARTVYDLYRDYPLADADGTVLFCEVEVVRKRFWGSFLKPGFVIYTDGQLHGRSMDLPLALPSLEWAINYLIATSAHRYLMVHAAVVERDGRALVMPGNPGSGKSTLCAALVGRGWRLLSDEFALLRPEDSLLVPMPRPVSLKNRSVDLIRVAAPQMRFGPVVAGTPKGSVAHAVPPLEAIRRQAEPARPHWVVFPTWRQDEPSPGLAPLSRAQAFTEITEHAMNYEISGETGFRAVRGLVESCAAYSLSFSSLAEAIGAVESLDGPAVMPQALAADAHVR